MRLYPHGLQDIRQELTCFVDRLRIPIPYRFISLIRPLGKTMNLRLNRLKLFRHFLLNLLLHCLSLV